MTSLPYYFLIVYASLLPQPATPRILCALGSFLISPSLFFIRALLPHLLPAALSFTVTERNLPLLTDISSHFPLFYPDKRIRRTKVPLLSFCILSPFALLFFLFSARGSPIRKTPIHLFNALYLVRHDTFLFPPFLMFFLVIEQFFFPFYCYSPGLRRKKLTVLFNIFNSCKSIWFLFFSFHNSSNQINESVVAITFFLAFSSFFFTMQVVFCFLLFLTFVLLQFIPLLTLPSFFFTLSLSCDYYHYNTVTFRI